MCTRTALLIITPDWKLSKDLSTIEGETNRGMTTQLRRDSDETEQPAILCNHMDPRHNQNVEMRKVHTKWFHFCNAQNGQMQLTLLEDRWEPPRVGRTGTTVTAQQYKNTKKKKSGEWLLWGRGGWHLEGAGGRLWSCSVSWLSSYDTDVLSLLNSMELRTYCHKYFSVSIIFQTKVKTKSPPYACELYSNVFFSLPTISLITVRSHCF